jgi:hypothetical protein
MSSLIFLNTRSSETDINYSTFWAIQKPRLNVQTDVFRLSLQTVEFPNTVYPINKYNNQLVVEETGQPAVVLTLTPNNYTGDSIAVELAAQLNTLTGTYTVNYDKTSKKLDVLLQAGPAQFAFEPVTFDAYEALGITTLLNSAIDLNVLTVFDAPVNLSGSAYVDLVTNFSTHNFSTSTTANVLARIPLVVPFGNIVFYESATDDRLFITARQIDEIGVQLRDDRGNLFELPLNAHLSLVLKLSAAT